MAAASPTPTPASRRHASGRAAQLLPPPLLLATLLPGPPALACARHRATAGCWRSRCWGAVPRKQDTPCSGGAGVGFGRFCKSIGQWARCTAGQGHLLFWQCAYTSAGLPGAHLLGEPLLQYHPRQDAQVLARLLHPHSATINRRAEAPRSAGLLPCRCACRCCQGGSAGMAKTKQRLLLSTPFRIWECVAPVYCAVSCTRVLLGLVLLIKLLLECPSC